MLYVLHYWGEPERAPHYHEFILRMMIIVHWTGITKDMQHLHDLPHMGGGGGGAATSFWETSLEEDYVAISALGQLLRDKLLHAPQTSHLAGTSSDSSYMLTEGFWNCVGSPQSLCQCLHACHPGNNDTL